MNCSRRWQGYGSTDDDDCSYTDACADLKAGPNADYGCRVAVQYLSRRVIFQYAPCAEGHRWAIQRQAGAGPGDQGEGRRAGDGGKGDISQADDSIFPGVQTCGAVRLYRAAWDRHAGRTGDL